MGREKEREETEAEVERKIRERRRKKRIEQGAKEDREKGTIRSGKRGEIRTK